MNMNNSHITIEVVTPKRKPYATYKPRQATMRLTLHSHPLDDPQSVKIRSFDTRSERGFRKRLKELRKERDFINSGGF
jgi:hypothetical protein